jgi:hypothetical protein
VGIAGGGRRQTLCLFEESHFGLFLPQFGLKKGYFDAFYPVLNSRWAPTWAPPTIVFFFAHYTHKPNGAPAHLHAFTIRDPFELESAKVM